MGIQQPPTQPEHWQRIEFPSQQGIAGKTDGLGMEAQTRRLR